VISLQKSSEKSFLENSIESLRKEMIRIGFQEGLTSEKTIRISQELDMLILEYQAEKRF
jgi:hypothetical protein